uniref:Uncharacterized protein n=1 Tax=Arundo donax TaxID=35708 RepID=A0A0A9B751_ARUDO
MVELSYYVFINIGMCHTLSLLKGGFPPPPVLLL